MKPKIYLDNISIPFIDQPLEWKLTAGVKPYITSFLIPTSSWEKLKGKDNPLSLKIEIEGGTDKLQVQKLEFKNIYLLRPKFIDPFHVRIFLADSRWSWRGMKVFGSWNKTRIQNFKGNVVTTPDTNPASLRKLFDKFKNGRYLSWSVKEDGTPYSIREILENIMGKLGISYINAQEEDYSYMLENIELEGHDIYRAFENLLSLSRMNLGIRRDGSVYVYSIDYIDQSGYGLISQLSSLNYLTPNRLYSQDLKWIRPKYINVLFRRQIETRVIWTEEYIEEVDPEDSLEEGEKKKEKDISIRRLKVPVDGTVITEDDVKYGRAIGCQNVIQVPYPVKIDSREYSIGEWVSVKKYLEGIGITESGVRAYWFGSRLEGYIARELAIANGTTAATDITYQKISNLIAAAIKTHYRQTFKIDQYWCDRMKSWGTRRVGVINNFDKYRANSPCYIDHCYVPYVTPSYISKRKSLWSDTLTNWKVSEEDPYRQNGTALTVGVISPPHGIFRIVPPSFIDYQVQKIIPSCITGVDAPSVGVKNYNMASIGLDEDFFFETILSVIWDTDQNGFYDSGAKYYLNPVDFTGYGDGSAKGLDIDLFCRLENARYKVREIDTTGKIKDPASDLINLEVINALALTEATRIFSQFINRVVGYIKVAGWHNLPIFGNIMEIIYHFNRQTGVGTTIDARAIPIEPTNAQLLDQRHIAFLEQQVGTNETLNDLK